MVCKRESFFFTNLGVEIASDDEDVVLGYLSNKRGQFSIEVLHLFFFSSVCGAITAYHCGLGIAIEGCNHYS